MFPELLLATALIGSCAAAAYDLKTTEIPDEIFYVMLGIGIPVLVVQSYLLQSIWPILISSAVGLVFLGFGFLMYKAGQWGGADAKLLAVLGFLLPELPAGFTPQLVFPFPISLLFNVFLIGTPYMLIYAVIIALMNRDVIHGFFRDVKASANLIALSSILLFIFFVAISFFLASTFRVEMSLSSAAMSSLVPVVGAVGLFIVWKFARAVEDIAFKKRIPVRKLRVGDVLLERREFEGITEEELRKIKRSKKKYVWIKEGIRFAPAFPLALVFTLYFGDAIFLFIKFLV